MLAVIDDNDNVIYYGETRELMPASLVECDEFGNPPYLIIEIDKRPPFMKHKYNRITKTIYEGITLIS